MRTRVPFAFVATAALLAAPSVPALTVEPFESTCEQSRPPAPVDQTHARIDCVLREFVPEDARVKYRSLKARRGDLDVYLEEVSNVRSSDFDSWPEERQLALIINLYNADPTTDPRPLPGQGHQEDRRPLQRPVEAAGGQDLSRVITLDPSSTGSSDPSTASPASIPPSSARPWAARPSGRKPYTRAKLGAQLDDRGRPFLADTTKYHVDTKAIHLSPIFKWFEEDFTEGLGPMTDYVQSDFPEETARRIGGGRRFSAGCPCHCCRCRCR